MFKGHGVVGRYLSQRTSQQCNQPLSPPSSPPLTTTPPSSQSTDRSLIHIRTLTIVIKNKNTRSNHTKPQTTLYMYIFYIHTYV